MAQSSPTVEGFRAVFRQPSLALAEIAWRWTFGAATGWLLVFSLIEYLDTLPVTAGELLFLRSKQPFLVSQAVGQIFAGSGHRLVGAALVLVPASAVLWISLASLGRAVTLKPLLDYFGSQQPVLVESPRGLRFWRSPDEHWCLRSLAGVNFLRVALALAAVLGVFGTAILAGFASSHANPQPGLVFLIFVPLTLLVALLWSAVNWFLSLAAIFVIRDAQDTFGAISATIEFCRGCAAAVAWSSTAFGVLHLLAFVVASSVIFLPIIFITLLPPRMVLAAIVLLTLVYFAVADYLHMGRVASYVCILQTPDELPQPSVPVPPTSSGGSTKIAEGWQPSAIDSQPELPPSWPPISPSDDDILSDIPGLVPPPSDLS